VVCEIKEKGFSLVELLVVIAILAIVVTIGSFSYKDAMRGYRVKKAVTDVKTLFHFARTTAAKENKLVFVHLTKDAEGFNFDVYLDKDNSGDLDKTKDEFLSRVRLQANSLDPGKPADITKSYVFDSYVALIDSGSLTLSNSVGTEEDASGNISEVTSINFVNEGDCIVDQTGFFDFDFATAYAALLFRNTGDVADGLDDRQYALLIAKTGLLEVYKYNVADDKWEKY
jgi:prepilin-type N-terminal cleavage/methylation domain-containing protein